MQISEHHIRCCHVGFARNADDGLSNVLELMLLYLGGYLVLTTIILASLKIKDDK